MFQLAIERMNLERSKNVTVSDRGDLLVFGA